MSQCCCLCWRAYIVEMLTGVDRGSINIILQASEMHRRKHRVQPGPKWTKFRSPSAPFRPQVTSLSAELADVKQRAREERRQLSLELASTRTEAAASAERAGEGAAALADAQGIIEELTARLRRCELLRQRPRACKRVRSPGSLMLGLGS